MLSYALALLLSQGFAPQRPAGEPLTDPVKEARVQRLGKLLRCAVCQGVAISDSPASMAKAQLDKVRELVSEDKSDQEILDYFVARYGEWVLLEPTKGGLNTVLWVGPVALLVIGVLVIVLRARRAPAAPGPEALATASAVASGGPGPDDDFLAQVRADVEK